ARNLPPALVQALVARGVWTPTQARAWARRAPTPSRRAELLGTVALHLPEPDRGAVLREALAAAGATADPAERAGALTDLAAGASPAHRPRHRPPRRPTRAAVSHPSCKPRGGIRCSRRCGASRRRAVRTSSPGCWRSWRKTCPRNCSRRRWRPRARPRVTSG